MKLSKIAAAGLSALFLLAGCAGGSATSSTSSASGSAGAAPPTSASTAASALASAPQDSAPSQSIGESIANEVYRGEVVSLTEEQMEVAQLTGHDYGCESIVFNRNADTLLEENGFELAEGAFVEVYYSGALTRSLPPQGTAEVIHIVSSGSEGILLNGTILSVEPTETGYTIGVLPFEGTAIPTQQELDAAEYEDQIVLLVPSEALEGLSPGDLQEGVPVSAVTRGIAALSLPPQVPVIALLPFTVPEAASTA